MKESQYHARLTVARALAPSFPQGASVLRSLTVHLFYEVPVTFQKGLTHRRPLPPVGAGGIWDWITEYRAQSTD